MVLYRLPECWGYAELKQAWRYMTRSIRKQTWVSRSTKGHHLNKFGSTWATDTVYQVLRSLASWFRRRRFLRFFFLYMGLKAILVIWPRTFEQIFIPNIPQRLHMKFGFNSLVFFFWGREVWNCWIWVILDKGQWMTLTFGSGKSSCTYLFDCIYQLPPHRLP